MKPVNRQGNTSEEFDDKIPSLDVSHLVQQNALQLFVRPFIRIERQPDLRSQPAPRHRHGIFGMKSDSYLPFKLCLFTTPGCDCVDAGTIGIEGLKFLPTQPPKICSRPNCDPTNPNGPSKVQPIQPIQTMTCTQRDARNHG